MSSVSGSGGSGGADSASRAESARAEAARAEAARQAEASRKAAEEAAKAQAVKAQNPFAADTFTAAVAKAPVELNPSPVSASVTTQQVAQVDTARQAEATQSAEAAATAEVAQAAEAEAAVEAEASAEAEASTEAAATAEAEVAQQAQTPTVTEEDVAAALQELPDVELNRIASEAEQTPEMAAQTQQVQAALQEMGYVATSHVTGFFGSITEGAIKSYQYENGMTVTGTYDEATREAMANSLAEQRAAEAQGITEPAADLPDEYTPVTDEQLADIMPAASPALRETYLDPLNEAMEEFNISTPERQAAFLSQVAAETADLQFMSELEPDPALGDYFGRGTLQLTHRDNYVEAGTALGERLSQNPNQVATDPDLAARTGAWYFNDRGLNQQADRRRIGAVTLGVNGGYNGIDRRLEAYDRALDVLGD